MTRTEMMRNELEEVKRHNRADEKVKRLGAITQAISGLGSTVISALTGKMGLAGAALNTIGRSAQGSKPTDNGKRSGGRRR